MKLIDKNIIAIAKNISAESNIRPTLASVCIRNGSYYATDSYKAIKFPIQDKLNHSHFPFVKGEEYLENSDQDIIIKSKYIEKLSFNKKSLITVCDFMAIANYTKDSLDIVSSDFESADIKKVNLIKGKFPDIDSFFKHDNDNKVALDINYMMDILKTFKECGINRVIYEIGDKSDGVMIRGYEKEHRDFQAMVMPLRLDE